MAQLVIYSSKRLTTVNKIGGNAGSKDLFVFRDIEPPRSSAFALELILLSISGFVFGLQSHSYACRGRSL